MSQPRKYKVFQRGSKREASQRSAPTIDENLAAARNGPIFKEPAAVQECAATVQPSPVVVQGCALTPRPRATDAPPSSSYLHANLPQYAHERQQLQHAHHLHHHELKGCGGEGGLSHIAGTGGGAAGYQSHQHPHQHQVHPTMQSNRESLAQKAKEDAESEAIAVLQEDPKELKEYQERAAAYQAGVSEAGKVC